MFIKIGLSTVFLIVGVGILGLVYLGNNVSQKDMIASVREVDASRSTRQQFIEKYGSPSANTKFWDSISPVMFVSNISGPVQIHHGLSDETVLPEFSESLYKALVEASREAELYTYPGNDHTLSQSFGLAIQRSVEFFDRYLK